MKLKIIALLYFVVNFLSAIFIGVNAKNPMQAMGFQMIMGILFSIVFLIYSYKNAKKYE